MTGTTTAPAGTATTVPPYPLVLDRLHADTGGGRLVAAPGGQVLASPATLPAAPSGPLSRFGLVVATGLPDTVPVGAVDAFADGLLLTHHRLLRHTVDRTMIHLDGRTSAGESLLNRQLVAGELAEVAMDLNELAAAGHRYADDRRRRWAYRRMVGTGRRLLHLLGASGFLADGPAGDLHLAEVAGNAYLSRPAGETS